MIYLIKQFRHVHLKLNAKVCNTNDTKTEKQFYFSNREYFK